MSHLGKLQVLSLGKFKVCPQSTQSGHFGHMTRKTVNVLAVFCSRKCAEKPSLKFLNLLVMYWTGIEQEHCPCRCSVFAMFQGGKLGFVPSVRHQMITEDWRSDEGVPILRDGCD